MKKADNLTLVGVLCGLAMVVWGMMGESGFGIFIDAHSLAITVGGSFCALLVTYSLGDIKRVGKLILQSTKEEGLAPLELTSKFGEISKKARKEGLLSLEEEINAIEDEFMKKGLQMVVDGIEPETISEILELEIEQVEGRHKVGVGLMRTWGEYAPAFGMVGTLIGLIKMLANLGGDVSAIADGMSVSLITTFYGALFANLIFLPIGNNLELKSNKEMKIKEMMLEGILAIQSGVNPRIVEEKLLTYIGPEEKKTYETNNAEGNLGSAEGAID